MYNNELLYYKLVYHLNTATQKGSAVEKTKRTEDTPDWAKFVVWQFGTKTYCHNEQIAIDLADEFWAANHSSIMEIEDK